MILGPCQVLFHGHICGDFNAYHRLWGSAYTTTNGETVHKFVNDNDLVVLNDVSGTRLDIRSGKLSAIDLSQLTNCGSDPYLVSIYVTDLKAGIDFHRSCRNTCLVVQSQPTLGLSHHSILCKSYN